MNKGAFTLPCDLHPDCKVTHVCLAQKCPHRYSCSECRHIHPKSHSQFFKQIDLLSTSSKNDLIRMKLDLDDSKRIIDKTVAKIQGIFKQIQADVKKMIDTTQQQVIQRFQKLMPNESEWSKLNAELETYLGYCTMPKTNDQDILFAVREKYAQKCAELNFKVQRIRLRKDQLKNQNFVYENEVDGLINTMRHSFKEFTKFLIRGDEDEQEQGDLSAMSDFSLKNLTPETVIQTPHQIHLSSFKLIPQQNILCLGDIQGFISVYNATTLKRIFYKKCHSSEIVSINYSHANSLLITATSDDIIKSFKINQSTGQLLQLQRTTKAGLQGVSSMLVMDKINRFYITGKSPEIKIFDTKQMSPLGSIPIQGIQDNVSKGITYIPSLNCITVPFKNGNIGFYNIQTNKQQHVLQAFKSFYYMNDITLSAIQYLPQQGMLAALVHGVGKKGLQLWKLTSTGNSEETPFEFHQEYQFKGNLPIMIQPINKQELLVVSSLSKKLYMLDLKARNWLESDENLGFEKSFSISFSPKNKRLFVFDIKEDNTSIVSLKYQ